MERSILRLTLVSPLLITPLVCSRQAETQIEDRPWPPPYIPDLPYDFRIEYMARALYGIALASVIFRLVIYYSLVSKQMYLVRLTLNNALNKLTPVSCAALNTVEQV